MPQENMNNRVTTPATAPPDAFNIQRPSPTAGYQPPGNPAPNPGSSGFTPRPGEGNAAARSRVISAKLAVARSNGGSPADNG